MKQLDAGLAQGMALIDRPGASVVVPAVLGDESILYRPLGGVPVLARTLIALDQISQVREIIVVTRAAQLGQAADLCWMYDLRRVRKVVCAKAPGLETLTMGVYECDPAAQVIAIHDPLRPFVTEDVFADALAAAMRAGASAPAVPVKDTIKIVCDGVVQETPDRSSLHLLQTPQMVESSLLKAALDRAREADTEAVHLPTMLELLGIQLQLSQGSDENIRVGSVTDLPAAEAILAKRMYL